MWTLMQEYNDLVKKGINHEEAWGKIRDFIWNDSVDKVNHAGDKFDITALAGYGEIRLDKPAAKLTDQLHLSYFDDVMLGKAPKELYNILLQLNKDMKPIIEFIESEYEIEYWYVYKRKACQ